jgi:hypothetical protein
MSHIPPDILRQVRLRANRCCEYCSRGEGNIANLEGRLEHQAVHIIPPRHGGSDDLANLAWVCPFCKDLKGTDIGTVDIETNQKVWLYNPREDTWADYFEIRKDGQIVGKTPAGRATIRLFNLNSESLIVFRREVMKRDAL